METIDMEESEGDEDEQRTTRMSVWEKISESWILE